MRAWTLTISIVVHGMAAALAVAIPLFATTELPVPPRTVEYVQVTAALPPPPPVVQRREIPQVTAAPSTAAPLAPPTEIQPEPAPVPVEMIAVPTSVVEGIAASAPPPEPVPPPPAPPAPPAPAEPIRVGGAITRPERVRDVPPVYPSLARQAGIEGIVILEAVIDVEGSVRDVRVLRSIPLLDQAAVDAVRQWRFSPTRLNGEPVPVVMTVTVAFKLRS